MYDYFLSVSISSLSLVLISFYGFHYKTKNREKFRESIGGHRKEDEGIDLKARN